MRKTILFAILAIAVFFSVRYFENRRNEKLRLEESTGLILEQVRNVGKLVVTEGSLSQVYSYKDSRRFYLDVLSANKKALMIVNAEVSVAYDLSKLQTLVDPDTRTVKILFIPDEEISINPDIKYYDVKQDYLNQFSAEDYNKIQKQIRSSLRKKVENSSLKSNAKNRLISELQKIYILTNSMGWTLEYQGNQIESPEALEKIRL